MKNREDFFLVRLLPRVEPVQYFLAAGRCIPRRIEPKIQG